MTWWMALRLAKWVGLMTFSAGVAGAVLPSSWEDRQRAVYQLATPGFVLTWMAGYGLMRSTSVSMGSPWISGTLLLSLVTLQAIVWGVERPDRRRGVVAVVALGGLLGSTALMVARPGTVIQPTAEVSR